MEEMYTAHVTSQGGRDGSIRSSDGNLEMKMVMDPKEGQSEGTNPEQLFAGAYSACFHSALKSVAKSKEIDAANSEVTANVTLHKENKDYHLSVQLDIKIPDVEQAQVKELADAAHQVCPFSKATRNNIEVVLNVLTPAHSHP